jgi:hypothetical protein
MMERSCDTVAHSTRFYQIEGRTVGRGVSPLLFFCGRQAGARRIYDAREIKIHQRLLNVGYTGDGIFSAVNPASARRQPHVEILPELRSLGKTFAWIPSKSSIAEPPGLAAIFNIAPINCS